MFMFRRVWDYMECLIPVLAIIALLVVIFIAAIAAMADERCNAACYPYVAAVCEFDGAVCAGSEKGAVIKFESED